VKGRPVDHRLGYAQARLVALRKLARSRRLPHAEHPIYHYPGVALQRGYAENA
jgi:hypothetical protein